MENSHSRSPNFIKIESEPKLRAGLHAGGERAADFPRRRQRREIPRRERGDNADRLLDDDLLVYEALDERIGASDEMVKKLDAMRLVNLSYRDGRGRTRLISLRYDPGRVLEYLR